MKMKYSNANMKSHKIALIDHLHQLEKINVELELEQDTYKRTHLLTSQKHHVKSVKTLIPYLNSIGKLSDKETLKLMSLDLVKVKRLNIGFKIGGD